MNIFLNPCILLFMSFIISFLQPMDTLQIIPMLCATIVSSLVFIFSKKIVKNIVLFLYVVTCCFYISFVVFLPVVIYMTIQENKIRGSYICFLIPFLFHIQVVNIYLLILVILECVIATAFKIQYNRRLELEQAYRVQRDATKELALLLDHQNKDLLIQQEQEIRIATLDERNRIAREIHDNVGHLLSSSLIQIGALQIIANDDATKKGILDLRDTISTAMDSVRSSVHDLHAESLDLQIMIQKLIERFSFCEVQFVYDMTHSFKQQVIYHILAIIKECMNNTMKHSNAEKIDIIIREHPAFFQIICSDNGTKSKCNEDGIGLKNMQDRIDSLNGYVNITKDNGFKVFITLPKEDTICEW